MTQPNRPRPQFSERQQVATNDERRGEVYRQEWGDGEWTYWLIIARVENLVRYAEHELTEAGR